jgi:2-amino-4-hydroxy-6-hydroxymethyldihydropteridine diphosphokinase
LGGNKGHVPTTMEAVTRHLGKHAGRVNARSGLYASEPWEMDTPAVFINQALGLQTQLDPVDLMNTLLRLESAFGRDRDPGAIADRPIDIDILFYEQQVISLADLVVPHPRLHLRRFALKPLSEIAPGLIHPILEKSVATLLKECKDPHWVKPFIEPNQIAS